MKKLKLNKTGFAGAEVLSRAQLKKVMGGDGSGEGGGEGGSGDGSGDSPKVAACKNKSRYDRCTFDYQGVTYGGRCDAHMASELYCSTLL